MKKQTIEIIDSESDLDFLEKQLRLLIRRYEKYPTEKNRQAVERAMKHYQYMVLRWELVRRIEKNLKWRT